MANLTNPIGNNGGRFYSYGNRPVLIDCHFSVAAANANGLGITGLKGGGVRNVFMHTSQTAGTNNGYTNPNPASGYALIQLQNNYSKILGEFNAVASPVTGSALAINSSSLTPGNPYQIVTVGHGAAGVQTIAPVADVSGSLASTWFSIYDSYGNTFIIWFKVSGTGTAPSGVVGTLVQQSISTGDTAATIGADLVTTLNGLLANTPQNPNAPSVAPFSATGTSTVTVTNVVNTPFPGGAADGTTATGFTFAVTKSATNNFAWQQVGLPAGVIPAVNASFIATASGYSTLGGSTGTVKALTVSGITSIEIVGDPTQSFAPIPVGGTPNTGGWILVQFLAPTSASVTTLVPTAPADTTQIYMSFYVAQD